jgi:hypothetical protein
MNKVIEKKTLFRELGKEAHRLERSDENA